MKLTALFIGHESLTRHCAEAWLAQGHGIVAVVTGNVALHDWAQGQGIKVASSLHEDLPECDWVVSVANLSIIPQRVLGLARRGAVNFHDGPLPRHAGLNAPVWAILEAETEYGITWHLIENGVDEGDILVQRHFVILPGDTALTLNTRCFAAALDSFPEVIAALEAPVLPRYPQDLAQRSYHARDKRPQAAARLDFRRSADDVLRLIRALDHGGYANPIALPKIECPDGRVLVVGMAKPAEPLAGAQPTQVLAVDEAGLTVACATGAVVLSALRGLDGVAICPKTVAAVGDRMPAGDATALGTAIATLAPGEAGWRRRLASFSPAVLPFAKASGGPDWRSLPVPGVDLSCVARLVASLMPEAEADIAFVQDHMPKAGPYLSHWVPLRPGDAKSIEHARRYPAFAADLALRDPAIPPLIQPDVGFREGGQGPIEGCALSFDARHLHYDAARLDPDFAALLSARVGHYATGAEGHMPEAEREFVLRAINRTDAAFSATPIHRAFEEQVARTPDAVALICDGDSQSYAQLNAQANRAAHILREMGVGPGVLVGLCVGRSQHLLIGALAILKAGGAYVPMDPAYPAERLALYLEDSAAPVVVSESGQVLPDTGAEVLSLDIDHRLDTAPIGNLDGGAGPEDLAYVIYTSGSTGRPKGVMIEHRNVANFFVGMDARIGAEAGVWLAVTSLSFDISVLELFWTLSRGFKLVLMADETRALVSNGAFVSETGMDFSLYYWGNDDGQGPAKYELLLEGARFADSHGFCAVWTPERHFHAFGGPYPNPSVTGAAVAAVTKNIAVRAGSCVAPLHHPARIAEEWAVIDNLTNGRTGLGIASGWHPEDFVLRPENGPPNNKSAMYDSIDKLRRLWRGETVQFPMSGGKMVDVMTQPRPVSKEPQIWLTIAGNPDTWREAGEIGAHVLTHLLGQSIEELEGKITLYHEALRKSGHNPDNYTITLMLHTFVARDRELARRIARGPMKDYLRSAAGLVRQYAWAFPAFKKPQGITNPADLDLRDLSPEETEAILDFAFERYFEDSGLFGTVEDCIARVEQLKRLGIKEIACLIDYGIARETVLEGLYPLAEVLRRSNAGAALAEDDFSIAAQIRRHDVTHLQCTPSMARMIVTNDDARLALGKLHTMMVGGEALPGALVAELERAGVGRILNMYGPTETTIWSTTSQASSTDAICAIGAPIANTRTYVLDDKGNPCPVGLQGELWIGGAGVARGYWQREDLTAERFHTNPVHEGRIYRTGDLVRLRPDGALDFIGRADDQVKLRGYRIEPGEIEARAESFSGVQQCVVMVREDAPGDLRLVAYVTGTANPEQLREFLSRELPEHMVPAHIVPLEAMPLTPNRKIDRKALPAPVAAGAPLAQYEPPQSDVAARIAEIWQHVLNIPKVGARDNFFALGGHSLLAVQAHREIKAALGTTRLSITDIFRFPTLAALAAHLDDGPKPPQPATPEALGARGTARVDAMAARRALRSGRTT